MIDIEEHPAHSVTVELIGGDGNAFAIIGTTAKAIRREVGREESDAYRATAMQCGSYDELLAFTMHTVEVT